MDQEKIGKFIKEIRKKNNLTQKDLADKYNVTYQAVSKWENGKNLPDTALIKQMSKDFNISLDDIFEGEYSKKNTKRRNIYIISITLIIITLIIGGIYLFKHNDSGFEFKTIKTSCDNFELSGSIAYDNSKTSIYISNIVYCGKENLTKYKEIECSFYEVDGIAKREIDSYKYNGNITLEEFLKKVKFNVEHYSTSCKMYKENALYLEIKATDAENETTYYSIPLVLEENCK